MATFISESFFLNHVNNLCQLSDTNVGTRFSKWTGGATDRLTFDNCIIAGDSVVRTLFNAEWDSSVDIFLFGVSECDANGKLRQIIREITQTETGITLIRTENLVMFEYSGVKYQIILRLYKDYEEILDSFDIQCCSVGFDGTNVLWSKQGERAIIDRVINVDVKKRSTSYELRLAKFFNRGFCIRMPEMKDIGELEKIELPFMILKRANFNWYSLPNVFPAKIMIKDQAHRDYNYYDVSEIIDVMVRMLVAGEENNKLCVSYTLDDLIDERFSMNIEEFRDIMESILSELNLLSIHLYFDVQFMTEYMTSGNKQRVLTDYIDNIHDQLAINTSVPLKWYVNDPDSQICGSFNPVPTTDEMWYGEYLR